MSILQLRLHLFPLVLCVLTMSGGIVRVPHHCHYFENFTYLAIEKSLNWDEAEKHCQTFRGALPTPRDKNQMDILSKQIDWQLYKVKRYWIGLKNRGLQSTWHWKDGSPPTFTNWNKKGLNFDRMGMIDCAFVSVSQHHMWSDMTCNEKKDITTVCHLEGHAWSPWSKWGECDCDNYFQQRTRICGTFNKARVTCPCRGSKMEMRLCVCLSKWKKFKKDYLNRKNLKFLKSFPAESLVVCSVYCLQEKLCSGFSFSEQNTCNFYKMASTSSLPPDTTAMTGIYIKVDEGELININ